MRLLCLVMLPVLSSTFEWIDTSCRVQSQMSAEDLSFLRTLNCNEVQNAIVVFQGDGVHCTGQQKPEIFDCMRNLTLHGVLPSSEWDRRARKALWLCDQSWIAVKNGSTGNLEQAAQMAVDAWGGTLMRGHDCCIMLAPPYCYTMKTDVFDFAIPVLLSLFAMLFAAVASKSCALWVRQLGRKAPEEQFHGKEPQQGQPQSAVDLEQKLLAIWDQSCLGGKGDPQKALPRSREWGRAAANFFATMKLAFDFQADSVCNQFEHLISLWRSHAAIVTDRAIQDAVENKWRWVSGSLSEQSKGGLDVSHKALHRAATEMEPDLLKEALHDLHQDLLEGLREWSERLQGCSDIEVFPTGERQHRGILAHADAASSKQLVEIGVYLLVWGEAGNIRFMPELIYFLTELALASEDILTGGSAYETGSGTVKSALFLAKITRPIYNVVFEEWYVKVDVDPKNQRDKKVLKEDLHRFLPADTANYDDWNELFCDPARMAKRLVLDDGSRLFDMPHERRFGQLHRVDWRRVLAASGVKTHREVHSLWGVFASIHRVVLLHAVLFVLLLLMATENEVPAMSTSGTVLGKTRATRFAVLGLLVPLHGFALYYSRWEATGTALRIRNCGKREIARLLKHTFFAFLWVIPAITYIIIRFDESIGNPRSEGLGDGFFAVLTIHYVVSAIGIGVGLFLPIWSTDAIWSLTRVSVLVQCSRYLFWGCVLAVKCVLAYYGLISKMLRSVEKLRLSQYSQSDIYAMGWRGLFLNAPLSRDFLEGCGIWGAAFFLFFADTLLWHILGCTILGVCYVFVQRRGRVRSFVTEDSVSKIQKRFPAKVLPYAMQGPNGEAMSFYGVWDRIVEFLRYEGKVTSREIGDLSYCADADSNVQWKLLNSPLDSGMREFRRPQIFRGTNVAENFLRRYMIQGQEGWPTNREAKWRLQALARGLGLPLPVPYRVPYIPGISVLIPHYGESILAEKQLELLREPENQGKLYSIPLMDWLADKYKDEFDNFSEKMTSTALARGFTWPKAGKVWGKYTDEHWEKLSFWASMRLQTLFRTVAGMMHYHQALQCHFEAQGDRRGKLGQVWDPSDAFTCIVAMQMYAFFNPMQLKHTNIMFRKFPRSMKVAFIDYEDLEAADWPDGIHEDQKRRYYSCLIDASCPPDETGRRKAKYKIELPGFPILGDGKGDNQNSAIPFTRGTYVQCIDANQGAYFEQMLLLPNVLGEFRSSRSGGGGGKKIIGFPEHITSDFGSVGDFAASSELAFGTISQRAYALLGARMHYGHPDIMNKEYMMQQGGVSKATKTLNLSEDIFAGMDFVLRGGGRTIMHREYFHLAKGRDLGFNTVLAFFSKLSSGAGEQLITRQTLRLGSLLPLPEFLSFYYAHMGHYLSQWAVSWGLPVLTLVWLLILLNGCEDANDLSVKCSATGQSAASVMAEAWQYIYSGNLLIVFLLAQMAPIFFEVWMQAGLVTSIIRLVKQLLTLSPIMFIFQAKVIGFYTMNELKYGGATYVATGRGLPTERRPFVGVVTDSGRLQPGGLYLDYARITYYDGAALLLLMVLVVVAGGMDNTGPQLYGIMVSLCLVTVSWLLAPFIFNPYQFRPSCWANDMKAWLQFFLEDGGSHWKKWFTQTQLKPRRGFRATILDLAFFIELWWVVACFSSLNARTAVVCQVSAMWRMYYWFLLLPPVITPAVFCVLLAGFGAVSNCWASRWKGGDSSGEESYEALAEANQSSSCPRRCPMILVSFIITALTVLETIPPLQWVASLGWKKACMLAFLLKLFWLRLCVGLAMTAIRSWCFERLGGVGRPLELWLDALCMFRDFLVSLIIFLALSPLVFLSGLSEFLCPTFSIHHLIIYRQPGHTDREKLDYDPFVARMCFDCHEDEDSEEDSESSVSSV